MAKKVSTTVIGGFVVSAVVLLITAVVLFGSGSFLQQTASYVLYFEESIKGLGVGSSVMFRGVEIGTVKSIVLHADQQKRSVQIPVTIEIKKDKFQVKNGHAPEIEKQLDNLIKLGLRAQLDIQSIVTGQLIIQLDFLPDTPINLSGFDSDYPEIPTIQSPLAVLTSTIRKLPLNQIAVDVQQILAQINKLLGDRDANNFIGSIESAAVSADRLMNDTNKLVLKLDGKVDSLIQDLEQTEKSIIKAADSVTKTLRQADATLATVDDFVDHSDTRAKLNRTLDEITSAARSLGELSEYLERHPEALLKGKNR